MRSSPSVNLVLFAPGVGERFFRDGLLEGPGVAPGGFGIDAAFAAAFLAVRSRLVGLTRAARGDCRLLEGERPLWALWRDADRLWALGSRAGGVTGTAEPLAVLTPSP